MAYDNPNLLSAIDSDFESGTNTWYAATNCTTSVVSGQYITGTKSLRLTATATGTISISTPLVSGVVAGREYVARVPVFVGNAAAGRTITARILFYPADSTTNIGLADSPVMAPLATSSGWQPVNYPVVSALAPANAARVRILLTITGLTAGQYMNVDNVYVGEVKSRAGQLLDYATASAESGTAQWTVTNGSLSRVAGLLDVGAGYYVLGATSTAAGQMPVRTAAYYSVTAGKDYVLYAAVQGTVALSGPFGIEFYDAANTWISTTYAEENYSTDIRRLVYVGTAPANAAKAKILIRPQVTAAGQTVYVDDVSLTEVPNAPGNLLTYDEYSTEMALPAWTVNDATTARGFFASNITDGYYALYVNPLAQKVLTATLDRLVPVTAGESYQVGATLFRKNGNPGQTISSAARVFVDWYDDGGNLVEADNPDQFYPVENSELWYAQINTETRTCPPTATRARVGMQLDSTDPLITAWFVDNIFLKASAPEYELTTDNERGSVSLTINATSPTADTVTIQRVDENGHKSPLRGYGVSYEAAPYTPGPILVEDYEVPLGTRVWYAVTFGGSTYRLYTQSIDGPTLSDGDYIWFKSPGIPALNTTVMMEAPPSWAREARSASYNIVGRKNALNRSDVRAGRTSSITILIWDPAANALFDSLLDSGLTALIQAMPGYGVEGNLYVAIGNATCDPLSEDAREDGWRWTLEIAERDRPAGGLQGSAGITWQDVLGSYATWDEVFDTHDIWTNVLTEG